MPTLSTYTKLIVYFIIRLIGRMPFAPTQTKMRLIGRMPFAPTEEIQRAPAGLGLRARYAPSQLAPLEQTSVQIAVSTAWSSKNSTGSGGFGATRTLRSFAACAFGANVCADRGFNRPVKLIRLYRWLSKINTKTYN
jgi:hypothetical protein